MALVPNTTIAFQLICPFCRSANVLTADNKKSPSAYTRCAECGEMWHADRRPRMEVRAGRNR